MANITMVKTRTFRNGTPDYTLIFNNAELRFTNFEGRASAYNNNGDKTFELVIPEYSDIDVMTIDPATGKMIISDRMLNIDVPALMRVGGWNVKEWQSEDQTTYHINVRARFDKFPPKVVSVCGGVTTNLDEDTVGMLDQASVMSWKCEISPSRWELPNGKSGIKAYLKNLRATLEEDYFSDSFGDTSEEAPF